MSRDPSAGAGVPRAAFARCRPGARPTVVLMLLLCACSDARSPSPASTAAPKRAVATPAPSRASAPAQVHPASPDSIVLPGDVVATRAYVGQQVRVMGRCLPPQDSHPFGPAMGGREVWQLEWEGVAVYVIGRTPDTCRTEHARVGTVTITATVAEDTLPAIGDLPPAPRRYLVVAGDTTK